MKLFVCSDIHGDAAALEKVLALYDASGAERLILLGDLLYHGPRNDLPAGYAPKEVIRLLNARKSQILAVRGNCEAEVDQMVLDFPVLADYAWLCPDAGVRIFATHGHHYNTETPPPLCPGDILLHGHTHLPGVTPFGKDNVYLNPGSASIPKGGFPASYMLYEDGVFTILSFSGEVLFAHTVKR